MIRSKKCFKCKVVKPITEFYKHSGMADGLLNKCKECAQKDVSANREKNIERIREYDRNRAKNADRIKHATAITKAWRAEDSRRMAAHNAVARAIKSGRLIKQNCSVCGSEKSVAHHPDYNKKLFVVWLCQTHHMEIHKCKTKY